MLFSFYNVLTSEILLKIRNKNKSVKLFVLIIQFFFFFLTEFYLKLHFTANNTNYKKNLFYCKKLWI
jgi:hypothetical protein